MKYKVTYFASGRTHEAPEVANVHEFVNNIIRTALRLNVEVSGLTVEGTK